MKRFTLVAAALALSLVQGVATPQTPAGPLSSGELQKLIGSNTAESNAGLARHFWAIASAYTTDARRSAEMATGFAANANRQVAWNLAPRSTRLASLASAAAATATEMATYHERLAGEPVPTPREPAADKGTPIPSAMELHFLAMTARGPASHLALEEYFNVAANKAAEDIESHAMMARAYRRADKGGVGDPECATLCDRLSKLSKEIAKEAAEAAALERQLAYIGD